MKIYTHLPESITINKIVFKRLNKPFIEVPLKAMKILKIKYRVIGVLSRNLRGRTDLYGKPYEPTKWVFVEENSI